MIVIASSDISDVIPELAGITRSSHMNTMHIKLGPVQMTMAPYSLTIDTILTAMASCGIWGAVKGVKR